MLNWLAIRFSRCSGFPYGLTHIHHTHWALDIYCTAYQLKDGEFLWTFVMHCRKMLQQNLKIFPSGKGDPAADYFHVSVGIVFIGTLQLDSCGEPRWCGPVQFYITGICDLTLTLKKWYRSWAVLDEKVKCDGWFPWKPMQSETWAVYRHRYGLMCTACRR